MRAFAHIATIAVLLGVFLGVPLGLFGNVAKITAFAEGQVDAVSGATEILEEPSGHFTVLINSDLHTDAEVLGNWETFLAGDPAPLIMEDVTCVAVEGDAAGIELAQQLQSRLPANQMKVRIEQGVLAMSKAEAGRFDIMVLSDEMAAALGASTLYGLPFVDVIHR